jgi:hypothetical protein
MTALFRRVLLCGLCCVMGCDEDPYMYLGDIPTRDLMATIRLEARDKEGVRISPIQPDGAMAPKLHAHVYLQDKSGLHVSYGSNDTWLVRATAGAKTATLDLATYSNASEGNLRGLCEIEAEICESPDVHFTFELHRGGVLAGWLAIDLQAGNPLSFTAPSAYTLLHEDVPMDLSWVGSDVTRPFELTYAASCTDGYKHSTTEVVEDTGLYTLHPNSLKLTDHLPCAVVVSATGFHKGSVSDDWKSAQIVLAASTAVLPLRLTK